jgi:hypothetical protein
MKETGGYEGDRSLCRRQEVMREKGGYEGARRLWKEKGDEKQG